MAKSRVWPIISLVVVCLITTSLWLGKMPFTASETNDPNRSSLQTPEPAGLKPTGKPGRTSIINKMGNPDKSTSDGNPDDFSETEEVKPENLTDLFMMTPGPLELSVEGATGWAGAAMPLYSKADIESDIVADFDAGQVFVIIEEFKDWWFVESGGGESGWVMHTGCLINLPDVIPSIAYNITNAYSALTRSSGYEIPGVTGQKLYDAFSYNPRLLRDEFIVPSLYSTSKLICAAQQIALEAGDTIIIHEAYRAHESQMRSLALLRELVESNEVVKEAINAGPWNLGWFMATTMSNHQRGVAFDASLGRILSYEIMQADDVFFAKEITYNEYRMPTAMHELSPLAISLAEPAPSRDRDAWRAIPLADTMTPGAIILRNYFDRAGFTPIASEWWHFNDLSGLVVASELGIEGAFYIDDVLSVLP